MYSTRHHKDLVVWQKARHLAASVYKLSTHFPNHELYGLVSQCRRASISILSNISEGSGRGSDKEFRQFLYIARGSIAELESQLLVASDLAFLSADDSIFPEIAEVGRILNGLIAAISQAIDTAHDRSR